jgi:hypothetical protein
MKLTIKTRKLTESEIRELNAVMGCARELCTKSPVLRLIESPAFLKNLEAIQKRAKKTRVSALKCRKELEVHLNERHAEFMTLGEEIAQTLEERGIDLDTANRVFEAVDDVLTQEHPRDTKKPGRPTDTRSKDALFLWERLKPRFKRKAAARIIAKALAVREGETEKSAEKVRMLTSLIDQTIRNAEINCSIQNTPKRKKSDSLWPHLGR